MTHEIKGAHKAVVEHTALSIPHKKSLRTLGAKFVHSL